MLNVDLSTLRGQELRQLLDTTRQRGQAALTYEILQEMAARRERGDDGPRGLFGGRRPTEPRPVTLELGDPLDEDEPLEMQADEAGEPETAEAEAAAADEAPIYLHSDRTADEVGRTPPRAPPPAAPPPVPRRWLWISTGIAIGLFVGLAIGGWADGVSREGGGRKAPATTLAAATPAPAPLAVPPAPVTPDPIAVETGTAPDAITPPVAPPVSPPASAAPPAAPIAAPPPAPAAELADDSTAETTPDGKSAKDAKPAKVAKAAKAATADEAGDPKACAGAPTPADRTICTSPRLQRLQRELRQAYAEALQAHQDRDLLRQRQLSWRDARNEVTEPDDLAQIYEQRIRKLNAATAEARRER